MRDIRLKPLEIITGVTLVLAAAFQLAQLVPGLQAIFQFPHAAKPFGLPDPDAWLRLVQARQFGSGIFSFFDHGIKMTNAPVGGIATPWTRPLDFILTGFAALMPESLGDAKRYMLAAMFVPALFALAAFSFLAGAARRHLRHAQVFALAALLFFLSPWYVFQPGNADHHGLLTMLWCGVIYFLLDRSLTARGAAALGILCGLMTWISPEGIMITGLATALMGAETLLVAGREVQMKRLAQMLSAAFFLCAAALFVEMPADDILTHPAYDTLSIVYVFLLGISAAAGWALTFAFQKFTCLRQRLALSGFAAAAVLGLMALAYPKFFLGPYAEAAPFIKDWFLPHVAEVKRFYTLGFRGVFLLLYWPLLAAGLMFCAVYKRRLRFANARYMAVLAALFIFMLGWTLLQVRWNYYLQPAALLAFAALLPGLARQAKAEPFRWLKLQPRAVRGYVFVFAAFLLLVFSQRGGSAAAHDKAACVAQMRYVLQTEQLMPLLGNSPRVVMMPLDLEGEALFFTPYRLLAGNYHREAAGMSDLRDIARAKTRVAAEPLLRARQVDSLFICRAGFPDDSWVQKIPAGDDLSVKLYFLPLKGDKPLLVELQKPANR